MTKRKFIKEKKCLCFLLSGYLFLTSFTVEDKSADLVSINRTGVSIRAVLSEIEESTSYRFLYNEKLVDTNKLVSINVREKSIDSVLKTVFRNEDVSYTIVENQVILSTAAAVSTQQQATRTLTGVVADVSGMGLPGVSVIVKGASGTVTDLDGNYSLSVPEGTVIVFRYVGFVTQEIKVQQQKTVNITLREDSQSLDEVVVVGYTTQKKADLTGAVASVKMSNLNDMSTSSINSALQGRMSGVTVLQSSGAPGSGTSIRIRGMGTFGNNDPLYVIDGMPADNMNDINPSDIDRIDVLKDAASAAIYGSRAANGVVIIQTKKGKDNDKINVTFNTYHGFSMPQKKLKSLNAADRNMIHLEAFANDLADGSISQADYDKSTSYYNDPYSSQTRTKWEDEVFSNSAYQSNYDISLFGGSPKAKYSVMAGNLSQNGILKETNFNRTTFRVNTEFDILPNLKFGENLMVTHSKQKLVPDMSASGAIISALRFDPAVPVYNSNGKYSGSGGLGSDLVNPVAIYERADRKRTRDRIFGNVYAQYTFLNDFTLKTDFGYDWSQWQDKWFVTRVPEAGRASNNNELTQREWQSTRWLNTTTLKYDKVLGSHKIMAMAGHSYEHSNMQFTNARGTGFISEDPSQRYLSAATNISWMQGGREEWALQSAFGRVDYAFGDRYLFSASFRSDGSSKFGKGNRWGYFPSVSAGWRISEESFFQNLKESGLESVKLRASWGKLGNQNIHSVYPTKAILVNTTDNDGYNVVFGKDENVTAGRYTSNLANPDLKWEVTTQTDIGLDISFLGKFDLGLDYYEKKSTDVLLQIPAPSMAGLTTEPWYNAAEVRNRGFDANLTYNTTVNGLQISAYGNISTVKNEVLSTGDRTTPIYARDEYKYRSNNIIRTVAGEPIAHFYGYKTDGIFKSQAEIDSYVNSKGEKYQANAKPGDVKFVNINDDDVIDGKDKTMIGNGFPDFTYGFGTDLSYKGFDMSVFFQGAAGYDIMNMLKYEGMFVVDSKYNQFDRIKDRFHPTNNPGGNLPRVTVSDPNGNRNVSDYYIDKGDYLKLKALTFGYTFNRNISQKMRLQKLRIYATVQNLFTITSYKGYDPDLGETYANELDQYGISEIGVDRGQFPQARTFIFGVNVNF